MAKQNKGELTAAQELKDIEKRIGVMQGVLRAYQSEKNNPQVLEKEKEYHSMQIEYHKKQFELLTGRQTGNGSHIDDMKRNIKLAEKVRGRLKHARAIEKLLKLYDEIKGGIKEDDDEDESD